MKLIKIDPSVVSEEELLSVLNHNGRVISMKQAEIRKLQNATSTSDIEIVDPPRIVKKESLKEEKVDLDFEEEVDYYLSEFRSLSGDELEEHIDEVLPVPINYRYRDIILRLIAEMNRDIKEIHEIVLAEKEALSSQELQEFQKEIAELRTRIALLRNALQEKNEINPEEKRENKLIFMPTLSGNIHVLEDLKNISDSYYEGFLGLFESIKDGTFKNIKRFLHNGNLKGALEVKDFKIRVVFVRLSKDCYAVITAFVKKNDNDKGYRRPIELRITEFRMMQEQLRANLNNPEFMEEQKKIEAELFQLLGKPSTIDKGVNK